MGDLIKFRPKTSHLSHNNRPPLSEDYAAILERIKISLEKINKLMKECRDAKAYQNNSKVSPNSADRIYTRPGDEPKGE